MKYVYCVFEKEDWQRNDLMGIFETEESADEFISFRQYPSKFVVQQWEVLE